MTYHTQDPDLAALERRVRRATPSPVRPKRMTLRDCQDAAAQERIRSALNRSDAGDEEDSPFDNLPV